MKIFILLNIRGYGNNHVKSLEKQYGQGDHAIVDDLKAEWSDLRLYLCMHCRNLSMADVLKMLTTDTTLLLIYPNFVKLAQVSLTLPINTTDCERAFSTMRRIKTCLHSEMNNTTLNHCMRLSIEGPKLQDFDFDSAVRIWSGLWNRCIFQ